MPGPRGGIVVAYAVPGIVPLEIGGESYPRQGGEPALRVHDNIVSQPLGQALFVQALGPVSVHGNQFTSRGLIMDIANPSFWAAAVFILNLGWSNEFYLQLLGFTGATADPIEPGDLPVGGDEFIPEPRGGLDDYGLGRYLANGNVLFTNNQVLSDLMEPGVAFAVSSVLIVSLDDVTIQDNQLDCDFLADVLFTNLLAAGMTLRINNNRFKETLFIALFSSVGLGLLFNNTSDNQATHCFLHLQSPLGSWLPLFTPDIRHHDNQELFNAVQYLGFWCERLSTWSDILVPDRPPPAPAPSDPFADNFGFVINRRG
jgi:hypothetical protein